MSFFAFQFNFKLFLTTKPLTRNQFSFSENALKLTYSNVEFQNFSGEGPPDPPLQGGMGRKGKGTERR
jgi:hypothetical protein